MADGVQYRLERMVDELDDLEQRDLFSRREIAEIVKQRRKFVYRLKRPSPLKEDLLAYVEYETQLKALRRLRKNSGAREMMKQGNKKLKKSKSDFAGLLRIIEIYELALKRCKGDVHLWLRYLQFCRLRKNGRMKKEGLRVCPTSEDLWVEYRRMELTYLNKLKAQKVALGEDDGFLTRDPRSSDEKQWRDENKELFYVA